jgi:hypothetical protein
VVDPRSAEPAKRRGFRAPILAMIAAVTVAVTVLVLAVAAVQVRDLVQGGTTTDRSGPVLLQSVRDLARYDAAAGNFQVIVDLEKDAAFLPTSIIGQRTLFVAVGSVDAYIDFSHLGDSAITVAANHKSAQVRLPHAALDKPNLDHKRSYVYAQDSGIVNRVQAFFDQSPNQQAELYQVAEQKIATAAAQSGIKDRAEANARTMLQGMLHSLGYDQVTVTYG